MEPSNRFARALLDGDSSRVDKPFAQFRQFAPCLLSATDLRYGKVEVERKPAEFLQAQLYRVARTVLLQKCVKLFAVDEIQIHIRDLLFTKLTFFGRKIAFSLEKTI